MGKKKGKKKSSTPSNNKRHPAQRITSGTGAMKNPLADLFGEMAKANFGDPRRAPGQSPIAKMTAPPENVIEHLTRVGAPFWVSEVGVDEEGNIFQFPCLTVPFEALIRAEAEAMQPGSGDAKVAEAKRLLISESAKRAIDDVAKMQHPGDRPKSIKVNGRPIAVEYREDPFGPPYEEARAAPDYGPPFPDPAAGLPEEDDDDDEWDLSHIQG